MTNQEAIDNLKSLRELAIGFVFEDSPKIVALDLALKALEREETCHNDTNGKSDFICDKCYCWTERRETEVLDTGVYGSYNYCPNCGRRVEE